MTDSLTCADFVQAQARALAAREERLDSGGDCLIYADLVVTVLYLVVTVSYVVVTVLYVADRRRRARWLRGRSASRWRRSRPRGDVVVTVLYVVVTALYCGRDCLICGRDCLVCADRRRRARWLRGRSDSRWRRSQPRGRHAPHSNPARDYYKPRS